MCVRTYIDMRVPCTYHSAYLRARRYVGIRVYCVFYSAFFFLQPSRPRSNVIRIVCFFFGPTVRPCQRSSHFSRAISDGKNRKKYNNARGFFFPNRTSRPTTIRIRYARSVLRGFRLSSNRLKRQKSNRKPYGRVCATLCFRNITYLRKHAYYVIRTGRRMPFSRAEAKRSEALEYELDPDRGRRTRLENKISIRGGLRVQTEDLVNV